MTAKATIAIGVAALAAFVLTFLRRGLPLVFDGNEIADKAVLVTANITPKPMTFTPFSPESGVKIDPKKAPMLAEGFTSDVGGVVRLAPYGFVAMEL